LAFAPVSDRNQGNIPVTASTFIGELNGGSLEKKPKRVDTKATLAEIIDNKNCRII